RDPALASADPTGTFCPRHRCQLLLESGDHVLQSGFAELRRVGVKILQLLKLRFDGRVFFWPGHCCGLHIHGSSPFRVSTPSRTVWPRPLSDLVEEFLWRLADVLALSPLA